MSKLDAIAPALSGPARPDPATGFCDVLIPCYNYGRYLPDCVGSVLAQGLGVRILIIDDASTDDSAEIAAEIARRYPQVEFHRHPSNRGHIRTYNEGIDWAEGALFTLLSADDLLFPGAVARARAVFSAEPDVTMVYGRELQFLEGAPTDALLDGSANANVIEQTNAFADGSQGGSVISALDAALPQRHTVFDTRAFYRHNISGCRVHASATFTRTETQKRLGGYLASLPHAGDYEMWLRFAAQGKIAWVPRFQVARRQHASNMWRGYWGEGDIRQRIGVLEAVAGYAHLLPAGLVDEMRARLAVETLNQAGNLLVDGDRAGAVRAAALASEIDPGVTRHPRWHLFRLKRVVGGRAVGVMRRLKRFPRASARGEP